MPFDDSSLAPRRERSRESRAVVWIVHALFFLSGLSALLYQLVWQRALLMIYGSNMESVALVVAAFLTGLGLGSLLGGWLSTFAHRWLLALFCSGEFLIGVYGLISLRLFHWAGNHSLAASSYQSSAVVFFLLLVPTVMMGATLPLLATFRVNGTGDVGRSVAWLYFVNTLGAAVGALVGVFVLFGELGMARSTFVSAAVNFAVALTALALVKGKGAAHGVTHSV